MANNRHAVNRNVLQSYWTSDALSLYSSQPACVKTQQNQHRERLAKIRKPHVTLQREEKTIVTKQTSISKNSQEPFALNRTEVKESKAKRVIKRTMLPDRHQRIRFAWCLARRGLNLRTMRMIHWSEESRFLLHVTDGRMRVQRQKNTTCTSKNIKRTVPQAGGSVMI